MTPAAIEPTTFRFVVQHLNHYATVVPMVQENNMYINMGANDGYEKLWTEKSQRLPVSQLNQYMLRTFMFIFSAQVSQVYWSIIPYLLDWGGGGWGVRGNERKIGQ